MRTRLYLIRSVGSALLLAVLAAACAPATSAPQDELVTQVSQIVGVWQTFNPDCKPGFMLIRPDGTLTWSCNRDGSAGISGTYHFVGSQLNVLNDFCGAEGLYQVYSAANSSASKALIFKVVKDDCAAEVSTLTEQKVTWISALP